jgi:predicted AlkP superfamily pyrophosphatase or phosphodiesterase
LEIAVVVFVMIDGLRPDAINAARCPNLTSLIARGASTLHATSLMPSITLPCHMSIFHSVPPARHGVTTNEWQPMARPLPGLIDVASTAGKSCGAIYNWEMLRNISRPLTLSFAYFRDTAYTFDGDRVIADEAARAMAHDNLDFLFVYFGTVDSVGHVYGWMSEEYLAQASSVDVELGKILAALPEDGHSLIQADHGGHERTHGSDTPEDITIPWIVAGPRIRAGAAIDSPVGLLDTAPTLARLLGITPHPHWEGRCIDEAFK